MLLQSIVILVTYVSFCILKTCPASQQSKQTSSSGTGNPINLFLHIYYCCLKFIPTVYMCITNLQLFIGSFSKTIMPCEWLDKFVILGLMANDRCCCKV